MGVAGRGDLAAEFLGIELFAPSEREGVGGQKGWRQAMTAVEAGTSRDVQLAWVAA